jgi:hypothetical protein
MRADRLRTPGISKLQVLKAVRLAAAIPEDQIVAEFDLGEEQSVLAARLFALSCSEKRGEAGQETVALIRLI